LIALNPNKFGTVASRRRPLLRTPPGRETAVDRDQPRAVKARQDALDLRE
jgi:hypothetical protein